MKHALARRPSASMVVAIIALIVAASGTAVAATKLVTGDKLIKKNSLSGNRLRTHSLTGAQINLAKLGTVPNASKADSAVSAQRAINSQSAAFAQNAAFAQSATVAQNAANAVTVGGKGIRWLLMNPGGAIVAQSGGFTLAFRGSNGNFVIDAGEPVAGHALLVGDSFAGDATQRGVSVVAPCGTGSDGIDCTPYNDGNHFVVATYDTTNTNLQYHAFYLLMY